MPYTLERACEALDVGDIFQAIDRILAITVGHDAKDPLDHAEYIVPRTTPMAPCYAGTDHNMGEWMPIRRTRILTVATDPVNESIVDDAEPFKVGDTVQAIDVLGPGTAITDLGAITLIDYATDTITTTNAANALTVDDWIEVTENGSAVDADSAWAFNRLVGMLKDSLDCRATPSDATGIPTLKEVVTHGSIRSADVNFPATPEADQILHWEFAQFSPASGGIQIISLEHGDELPNLVDAGLGL